MRKGKGKGRGKGKRELFSKNLCLALLICLSSCGYHFVDQGFTGVKVAVPYVEGDLDGRLTSALVHQIATRSSMVYADCGASYAIRVCTLEPRLDNVGFRFAPDKKGGESRILAATESRLSARAKVSVIECATGRVLLGPVEVFSFLDFDFDTDYTNQNDHAFSLGQSEMNQQASDNAFLRLNELLAQKIVDYVEGSW